VLASFGALKLVGPNTVTIAQQNMYMRIIIIGIGFILHQSLDHQIIVVIHSQQ
jgi:hypothetical protein